MSLFTSLHHSPGPSVAVELSSQRVSAATIDLRGGRATVAAHATEPLPAGALVPALTSHNMHDRDAVVAAVTRVLDRIGGRPRRVGLVIPDVVARVSIIKFERVPTRAQDLDQLVRWQVKKAAPFPLDEAQVTFAPGWRAPDGQEFVVAVSRRDIVEEYEGVCAAAGAHAGLVDLATFNVANAVVAGMPSIGDGSTKRGAGDATDDDWLLVNVAADYGSIGILRGSHLIFFRNRTAESDGSLADLVHQTAMYYEDRITGGGFSRVILAGASNATDASAEIEQLRRTVEERLTSRVERVDPRPAAAIADRIAASPELLDTLAPLVGVLMRGREVAA